MDQELYDAIGYWTGRTGRSMAAVARDALRFCFQIWVGPMPDDERA